MESRAFSSFLPSKARIFHGLNLKTSGISNNIDRERTTQQIEKRERQSPGNLHKTLLSEKLLSLFRNPPVWRRKTQTGFPEIFTGFF